MNVQIDFNFLRHIMCSDRISILIHEILFSLLLISCNEKQWLNFYYESWDDLLVVVWKIIYWIIGRKPEENKILAENGLAIVVFGWVMLWCRLRCYGKLPGSSCFVLLNEMKKHESVGCSRSTFHYGYYSEAIEIWTPATLLQAWCAPRIVPAAGQPGLDSYLHK
jgi:hypothetical protein